MKEGDTDTHTHNRTDEESIGPVESEEGGPVTMACCKKPTPATTQRASVERKMARSEGSRHDGGQARSHRDLVEKLGGQGCGETQRESSGPDAAI